MSGKKVDTGAQAGFGKLAPKLADLTDDMLFGDIWERPELSKRDRSVVTLTTLIAMYRIEQIEFHTRKALENGVTREEIVEIITHAAFYAGWPASMSAIFIAKRVFESLDTASSVK